MTDIFDVIADPTRRQLLTVLRDSLASEGAGASEVEVSEFVEVVGSTRPTVVKHLGVLRDAGLVLERVEGTKRYFTIDVTPLEEIEDWLVPFIGIGDATSAPVVDDDTSVFAAWSGADVGESIGRKIADRSHQARTAIHEASEKVSKVLPRNPRRPKP
jgi:DNA-binding transcriptional ArsR family regulator